MVKVVVVVVVVVGVVVVVMVVVMVVILTGSPDAVSCPNLWIRREGE